MIRFVKKLSGFLMFVAALFMSSPVYCASKKKSKVKNEPVVEQPAIEEEIVALPMQKRTFFYKIDDSIISLVENGTPESLTKAMELLRKNESEYEDNERVLIKISTEIMKAVWPSEKISWESFAAPENNPYIGAINSAHQGVFDSSTGNVDFLSTILPSLVLFMPATTGSASLYESCEQAVLQALQLNPDSVLANYILGVIKEKQQNLQMAQTYYKLAYDKAPLVQEASLAYARVLRQSGNISQASDVLSVISSGSSDLSVLKQNAYVAFDAKDYVAAEQYVARVLQQTPNDLEFVLLRAKILVEKNDYIHAVSLLDVYARQDSSSIDYLILRAKVQLDWSKNTAAATETIEKALNLYPDNFDALMIAARISSTTDSPVAGKYADDLAAKVLEKDPENLDALSFALQGLVKRENWQEAYQIGKKIIVKPDVSADSVSKYVQICIKLGKKQEAFDYAKKKYDENPSDEQLLQSYILAYSQTGSRDAVIRYLDSLMPTASSKMKSFLLYMRSYQQYSEDNSLADLRSSLISNPRNSDALFRLYEIYFAKKDYRKAQYYLRQVVAINPNDTSVKKLNEALTKLMQ